MTNIQVKIKVSEKPLKKAEFSFEEQEIAVTPHIGYHHQEMLIKLYLSSYFNDGKEDRLNAEMVNKLAILDLFTNINIDGIVGDELTYMIDGIVSSGLWEKIEKAIKNYREYTYNLGIAIDSKKKENSDIGYILKEFIDTKVAPMIERFGSMDFSDEKLAEIKSIAGEIGKQLSPETPVGSLISKGVV